MDSYFYPSARATVLPYTSHTRNAHTSKRIIRFLAGPTLPSLHCRSSSLSTEAACRFLLSRSGGWTAETGSGVQLPLPITTTHRVHFFGRKERSTNQQLSIPNSYKDNGWNTTHGPSA